MILTILTGMILRCALACGVLTLGVATTAPAATPSRPLIVAGVSEWGVLAHQLVGNQAKVEILLSDPNADPHEHEATVHDAGYVALASVVIENGAGYDNWLNKLVAVSQPHVAVVNVASLLGVRVGANPHLFYSPRAAVRFVKALSTLLAHHDPHLHLASRARALDAALGAVSRRVAAIKASCHGVRVAATEDVATRLLQQAGLDVVTPESLRLAVSNGVDPSISSLATALQQLQQRPAFLLNNVQTSTPLTQTMVARARGDGVALVNVTETMRGTNYVTFLNEVVNQISRALGHEGCLA
ncbi:MAG: hypothetical protein B7X07_02540 [Actinobacteria bacterium 21-64-8]|nr:MAG: hypothetical protein B7X07_02540 [Actinobacteria bacterium 21-64-8]